MKPDWLIVRGSAIKERQQVTELLSDLKLHTVCQEAACPNMVECFGRKTATFMIMGAQCTRGCTFCNVSEGLPGVLDEDEPQAVAQAVSRLGLLHVVITSVTRDDLEDGGAKHFANTIQAVRNMNPGTTIEVLIPDLKGDESSLRTVIQGSPDVIAHNIETIPALYKDVRPQANYNRSLSVLAFIKKEAPFIFSKSGIMLGLGEEPEQVLSVLMDLRKVGCDFVTIGQYLPPTSLHYPLKRYVHPDEFKEYEELAYSLEFSHVASGPLVRSSYHADEAMQIV
jgi:lipoyl synthase